MSSAPSHARAAGGPGSSVEHEPIPPDAANDVAFGLRLDGDLPAAIETHSGLAVAPDPRAAVPPANALGSGPATSLAGQDEGPSAMARFTPDTDTRRPDMLPYSDPFVPSTAPWKRLAAFDAVDADYALRVSDATLKSVPLHETARSDGSEDQFYGDLVVDLRPNELTRIPSVGPGSRVVHARLGVGSQDVDFDLVHDSAANWFLRSRHAVRARLVLELTIPRAVFGGAFREPIDNRMPLLGPRMLPPNIQRDAELVAKQIGVPRDTRRATIEALVDYFRGFTESSDPLPKERNVYLALALSRKGVCRHRAYAFMVTALGIGIPTRVVMNEAHAWVEVWDGPIWKRIDLGGAGTILDESAEPQAPTYAPPADPFDWPAGARRGEDLGRTATRTGPGNGGGTGSGPSSVSPGAAAGGASGVMPVMPHAAADTRPSTAVTIATADDHATRGQPVHVRGDVAADGAPCAHVAVAISVRDGKTGDVVPLGELATDDHGSYVGAVVVPKGVVVGDYELLASTPGDARCGAGRSP